MSNFEERLLSALKDDIASRKADLVVETPVRRRRVLGLAAAVAGVAAATLVAMNVYGGAAAPAFAVTKSADGSVEVRINEFRDPDELAVKLAAAGVTAVVDYLPADQTCKQPRGEHGAGYGRVENGVDVGRNGTGIAFRIDKGQVAAGQTLVLAVSVDQADKPPIATSLEVVKGAVAPCEATALNLPPASDPTGNGPSTDQKAGEGPSLNTNGG
ncbi:hypothetical protein [Nonomuraea sp. NEAU-A123]|uniref:hypothetical protein n=1 Tax=Nonomuraea sp. NEAU-A123 TaxID=2839649 RepID=UPI001BE4BDE0|nr:hypothetical protein [Nonomuraea sp. NEAU-A123]MBT2226324.1 hypothetical protein [Nonomuraea sp. NEAU-A123]